MTSSSVFELTRRYNLDLKKSLGQNLLIDDFHLTHIVDAADLTPTDTVLEIGPGLGMLTRHLAERAGRVVAVELDERLLPILQQQFAHQSHITFVHADILNIDPSLTPLVTDQWPVASEKPTPLQCTGHCSYKIVANLPYYITSAVLRHILEAYQPPTLAVVLVQWEVAQRIVARPGKMSLLAVSVQFYAQPRIVRRVPATAFWPRPKVDSAVLRLDMRPQPAIADVPADVFFRLVRAGFGQRRKQLHNSLRAGLGCSKEQVSAWLDAVGIDPRRRAESLSLVEWGDLARALSEVRPG